MSTAHDEKDRALIRELLRIAMVKWRAEQQRSGRARCHGNE